MKSKRRAAFVSLLVALVAILAAGFYLGVTHQEPRPSSSSPPDGAQPSPGK